MKIACVCLVLLVAVYTTAKDIGLLTPEDSLGDAGVLVIDGYASKGLACANSDTAGENIAKVACKSGAYKPVSSDEIDVSKYEWSIVINCNGNEKSVSECPKEGGPAGVTKNCNSYVGCA